MCRLLPATVGLLGLWISLQAVRALEWPGYRGPTHDGISTEIIPAPFPPEGPTQAWKVPLEPAFSSFAIAGGRAFTQARRQVNGQASEVCLALNLADGSELWAAPVDVAKYPDASAGEDDGPRSTPCVDGGYVYVLSSYLILTKLEAASGAVVWQKDLIALYGGQLIRWQNGASPLLHDDLIFVNCGSPTNSLLALRKSDGSAAWRSGAEAMTHATPVLATIQGVPQLLFFTQSGLVAVAPASGAELWRYAFPYNTSAAASPVVDGDIVYCSAAWGIGAGAVRVDRAGSQWSVTELWRDASLMNEFSTPVAFQGYLYGLFARSWNNNGPLKCIELATGAEMWSEPNFGPGGILLVGDKLLVTDSRGGVILVEPFTRAYNELGRFQAVAGKCWNSAALSRGRLCLRSTSEAACFVLAPDATPAGLTQSLARLPSGGLRLCVASGDGAAIDSSRLGRIQVRWTMDPSLPATEWAPLVEALTLADGVIQVDLAAAEQARYFIAVEQP